MEDPIKPTLQSIILRLQEYWAGQGCVIWQPYHTEVGAGTMNPGTYLRVLGPEDWRVAYVEPSIRPTDSRYGENPNRWGHYYQFQVIIKPDPGNPLELYLNSLIALGIDPQRHDIRFVEDNWEQPALGAWGLGWEVWLDGQEITQYTYFQQAGGKPLDPVSVEITYGLERIQLALQQVESFVDLDWNEYLTYGEVNLTAEREHSRYTYDVADVDRLRRLYDEYEAEAERCLEAGLVFPAHDYVLKCSHTFNLLDGRGAIGVTERAGLFTRMREQARRVTDAYLEEREELGYPWRNRWQGGAPAPPVLTLGEAPKTPDTFVLEIGTEELPVGDLTAGLAQLETAFTSMLEDERLGYHQLQVFGTPRRLVVQIEDLATAQEPRVSMEKGPPAERAFDSQGKPTKAAEGFARSKGVAVGQLSTAEIDGGEYVVVQVEETGESSGAVLQTQIPEILSSLRFEKSMRWNASQVNFSRPIRWILAMYGSAVVPFEFAGIPSGRTTRLMRFEDPETIELKDAKEYSNSLTSRQILLDPEARREAIQSQINELASEIGGEIPEDPNLLDEVANLVERPTALRGEFDREYLQLPRPVLVSVMKKHQRYFPVVKKENLLPYFIAVRNGGGEHIETVRQGNEHVIAARFADAAYFIQRDIQQPLEAYLPRLATLTFQSELGSMLDKTERIEKLTRSLGEQLELSKAELEIANRAAQLAKADLATLMVIEMTSLQGEIGREYALRSGEAPGVAEAIFEHYLPRHAGDSLPKSKPGIVVGLADRLDSLVGLFAIGSVPTGARDPFGLRRAAISMIQILIHHQIQFDIRTALDVAAQIQPVEATTSALDECFRYIVGRQQGLLLVEGYPHDAVTAVLAGQGNNPYGASVAVQQLATWRQREDWDQILQSFARCVRITRDIGEQYEVRASTLVEKAEKELFKALERAEEHTRSPGSVDEFFEVFLPMIPAITNFFDDVLVMAEDDALRENRLALLQRIVRLSHGVMDLSDLEGF